jgi:galactose mutarotase-like enzyme
MGQTTIRYGVREGELDGIRTFTLSSLDADLHATFAPEAGMVACSLLHAGDELLDLQGGLEEYVRSGAAMGIPLLYPWANRLAGFEYSFGAERVELDPRSPLIQLDENGLPIHGLLAGSPHWRLRRAETGASGSYLSAELDFGAHEELLAAFPFAHVIRIDIGLEGAILTIRTTVTPKRGMELPVSFGFHPYLRLPGLPRERWEITLPVRRRLLLDEQMIPTGRSEAFRCDRELLGERVFDDGFEELASPPSFVLRGGGRELAVTFLEGYPYAQVYSPARAEFICFEPMTAPTNALRDGGPALPVARAPGDFTAAFEVAVANP